MGQPLSLHGAHVVSGYLHLAVLAALALASSRTSAGEPDAESAADRITLMRTMLEASAARERVMLGGAQIGLDPSEATADEEGAGGNGVASATADRHAREPGLEGRAASSQHAGPPRPASDEGNREPVRDAALREAAGFGMLGTLAMIDPGVASSAPWRDAVPGATGDAPLWTGDLAHGLALSGLDATDLGGGSGRGAGIALDGMGGLAGPRAASGRYPTDDVDGISGMGHAAPGPGFGTGFTGGSGMLGERRGQSGHFARVCTCGGVSVNGRLPPEVIQRVVRQNMGRFRYCYERALEGHPELRGRVVTRFLIARDGSVAASEDVTQETDLADASAVACIGRGFAALSFPAPEGGTVNVEYPLSLSPTE